MSGSSVVLDQSSGTSSPSTCCSSSAAFAARSPVSTNRKVAIAFPPVSGSIGRSTLELADNGVHLFSIGRSTELAEGRGAGSQDGQALLGLPHCDEDLPAELTDHGNA